MGYESKLYVVEKSNFMFDDEGSRYCQVVAMFDLCKFYDLADMFGNCPTTDCYFYADDGNTRVLEDRYGDPLREATIEDVIDVLEIALDNGNEYRRIYPVLAALKALEDHKHNWKELAVLHYGY